MKKRAALELILSLALANPVTIPAARAQESRFHPEIPKTWDDAAMANLEIPLADPIGSPKHVSANYYYKIPVRPIYKEYLIYAPGREPPGYIDRLKRQEPVILWDDHGHHPPLNTREDWIRAGELVFEASPQTGGVLRFDQAQNPEWWAKVGPRTAKDGTLPGYNYYISEKGKVEVGNLSCASCHTRVMPDGTILKAAQGNFPFDHNAAVTFRSADPAESAKFLGLVEMSLYGTPGSIPTRTPGSSTCRWTRLLPPTPLSRPV